MIGAGIVTLPWAYSCSGIILGIVITILSFLVSLRTCILIYRLTAPGEDFYDTVRKYWGNFGYYLTIISTLIIVETGCTAYFLIMSQTLYPIILSLLRWIFKLHLPQLTGAAQFGAFS